MISIPIRNFVWFLCIGYYLAPAQQKSNREQKSISNSLKHEVDVDTSNQAFLAIGTDYSNRVLFWGRDFGEQQYGVSPYVFYNSTPGVYVYGQLDFWSKQPQKPARYIAGLGYEKQLSKKFKFFMGYEHWFNHYGDDYLNKALTNELEAGLQATFKKFHIEPIFYYFFGIEKMHEIDLSLSRPMHLLKTKNLKISIVPQGTITSATPMFVYMYYEFPDPDYDYEKLKIVDYEVSMAVSIIWKNFEIQGTSLYNVPIRINNEITSPTCYFTIELSYSL